MTEATVEYLGSCHCGDVSFTFRSEPITGAMRCNCSICRRKNALMSRAYYPAEVFKLISGSESLAKYRFPPHQVNHYFCKHCGVYPFHDGVETPGSYRINLGCVDEIDPHELPVRVFDGRDSWQYFD